MLAGLGAAVLPLALHILARLRRREVEWGAMMFLDPSLIRVHGSARLRQAVLVAMRMLAIALLAAALAGPMLMGRWAKVAGQGPVTAVIVLDRSYSMTVQESG